MLIVAGCGIHNSGSRKRSTTASTSFSSGGVRYVEKHYGRGDGTGDKANPETIPH